VFGWKGYNITFAEESADFAPVVTPFEDHRSKDGTENGSGGGNPNDDNSRDKDKKQKNDSGSEINKSSSSSGPTPMQIALTPFPKGVDVKQILQYQRRKHTIAPCKLGAPESVQQSESATVATMSMMKNKDTTSNLLVPEFHPSGEELSKEATDQYVTKSNPHHDAAESGTELAGKVNVAPV
jgi:hypothetical protein